MKCYQLILLLVALFFCTNCCAQDEFYFDTPMPHGSIRYEWGGLHKVAYETGTRFFRARWRDQVEMFWEQGDMTQSEFVRQNQEISLGTREWQHGVPWYYRHWWDSLMPQHGGAPETPIVIYRGRTKILLDAGIIYFTSALELKWRGLEMAVDFKRQSAITLGVGAQVAQPRTGWKLKFYPNVRLSTNRLFSNPFEAIRRVDINIGGVHSVRGKDIVAVLFNTWYNFEFRGWFFGFQLRLLQW